MADTNTPHVVVEEPRAGLFSNIIAIVGLIILIAIVIWGLVHLASLSRSWFSSLFHTQAASVVVTAPANATSTVPFTVSWKYSTSEKGNYAFLYQCRSGLTLKVGATTVPCGAAFTVGATTSLSLTPAYTGIASTSLPVSVIFLPAATTSKQAQGSATIAIHASQATVAVVDEPVITKPVVTPTKPVVKPAQTYAGPSDLSVHIIAVGVIDPYSGQFVNRIPGPNDVAAARFDIVNVGGSPSGTYYFSAIIPTLTGYSYVSPPQASLSPGDSIVSTLKWTQSNPSGGAFSVTINGGADSNSYNNYAAQAMTGGYYPQYQY